MTLVETHELRKEYRDVVGLKQCTFNVQEGEVFGLLGPNGAGKTTLLRIICGFISPTSGTATVGGLDCHTESLQARQLISYLAGDPQLDRRSRGREILRFFVGLRATGSFERGLEIAEQLELDLSRRVGWMSTGMRQKLALSVALSNAAPLVILDEPTANLDPTVRGQVIELIHDIKSEGRTVIFSSHVLDEVEACADRVVILRSGEIVNDQRMDDIRQRHQIHLETNESLPPIPSDFQDRFVVSSSDANRHTIDIQGNLADAFDWLSAADIEQVHVEPTRLKSVYDEFHSDQEESSP